MNNLIHGVKRTTYLNILVCGQSGIGKSSFIELFLKKFNLKAAEELLNLKVRVNKDQNMEGGYNHKYKESPIKPPTEHEIEN